MAATKPKTIKANIKIDIWSECPAAVRKRLMGKELSLKFTPIKLSDTITLANKQFKHWKERDFSESFYNNMKRQLQLFAVRVEQELSKMDKGSGGKNPKQPLELLVKTTTKEMKTQAGNVMSDLKEELATEAPGKWKDSRSAKQCFAVVADFEKAVGQQLHECRTAMEEAQGDKKDLGPAKKYLAALKDYSGAVETASVLHKKLDPKNEEPAKVQDFKKQLAGFEKPAKIFIKAAKPYEKKIEEMAQGKSGKTDPWVLLDDEAERLYYAAQKLQKFATSANKTLKSLKI